MIIHSTRKKHISGSFVVMNKIVFAGKKTIFIKKKRTSEGLVIKEKVLNQPDVRTDHLNYYYFEANTIVQQTNCLFCMQMTWGFLPQHPKWSPESARNDPCTKNQK